MSVNPTGGGNAFIEQGAGGVTLTNQDNTIEGAGVIGNGGRTFVNNATVNANVSGQALNLSASGGITNTAALEATGGGTLNLLTGITNTGGTITASGGTVNNASSIIGGALTSAGGGTFQTSGGSGTLNNLTISPAAPTPIRPATRPPSTDRSSIRAPSRCKAAAGTMASCSPRATPPSRAAASCR